MGLRPHVSPDGVALLRLSFSFGFEFPESGPCPWLFCLRSRRHRLSAVFLLETLYYRRPPQSSNPFPHVTSPSARWICPSPPPPTSLSRPLEGSACGLALVRPRPLPGSQDSREPGPFLRPPACQPVSSRPFQAFLRSQPFPHPGKLEVTIPSLVFTSQIAPWWKMVSSVGGHLIQSLSF